jgi:hypothetical protein
MKKLFGLLAALCLLTVLVSSASASGYCDPKTGKCATYQPKLVTIPYQHDGDINIIGGAGSANSESSAIAYGYCPEAFHQDFAGTTESSFYSQGIATASPVGTASSSGSASIYGIFI